MTRVKAAFDPEKVSLWEYAKAWLARRWEVFPPSWAWDADQWEAWDAFYRGKLAAAGRAGSPPLERVEPDTVPKTDASALLAGKPGRSVPDSAPRPASPPPDVLPVPRSPFPWRAVLALLLALLGQVALQPARRAWAVGVLFYGLAVGLWLLHLHRTESPPRRGPWHPSEPFVFRPFLALAGSALALAAFWFFGGNRYTPLNLSLWTASLAAFWAAFWPLLPWKVLARIWKALSRSVWTLPIHRITLFLLLALAVAVFFRGYRLDQVPPEMFSDHAEKLYDVMDVLDGQWRIFFPRNTGREDLQMYLTALMARLFGTGISFMSLKLGTFFLGLFMLPYLYLLGKALGAPWAGVAAVLLAGMAYWPNVQARVGLRYILYPAFVAPTLYHLVRGLQRPRPQDFILAGVLLGIGLHGYSTFRIVPLAVLVAVVMAALWGPKERRPLLLQGLALVALFAMVVFLPLFRYMLEHPDVFSYRAMSRLFPIERPYPGPVWRILLEETFQALVMPWWDNGVIWVHSVPGHPALALVSAALLALGVALALWRFWKEQRWEYGFLVLAVPILLLPSILTPVYPGENPSLNRSAGAMVPVFLLAGLALARLVRVLYAWAASSRVRRGLVLLFVGLLLLVEARHNYDLVFHRYYENFRLSAWNTSELGRVIGGFARSVGHPDRAWVVPYPHWVDTRLVGIQAGYPRRDYALWRERLPETQTVSGSKLFLYKPEDTTTEALLWQLYPQGRLWRYVSPVPGKDFMVFFVP